MWARLSALAALIGIVSTALIFVPTVIPVRTAREPGIAVDRSQDPELWRTIAEVAQKTGNRRPEELLLTPFPAAGSSHPSPHADARDHLPGVHDVPPYERSAPQAFGDQKARHPVRARVDRAWDLPASPPLLATPDMAARCTLIRGALPDDDRRFLDSHPSLRTLHAGRTFAVGLPRHGLGEISPRRPVKGSVRPCGVRAHPRWHRSVRAT